MEAVMTTTNPTKSQIASRRILALIAAGLTPVDALKAVCGAEVTDQMIDSLYHELRAKGA